MLDDLDFFTIFTKGGIVLWYFEDIAEPPPALPPASAVNALIKTVLLKVRTIIYILYQERMSVAKRFEGASNCHYICILTIVETGSRIIPYKEIHLLIVCPS